MSNESSHSKKCTLLVLIRKIYKLKIHSFIYEKMAVLCGLLLDILHSASQQKIICLISVTKFSIMREVPTFHVTALKLKLRKFVKMTNKKYSKNIEDTDARDIPVGGSQRCEPIQEIEDEFEQQCQRELTNSEAEDRTAILADFISCVALSESPLFPDNDNASPSPQTRKEPT